MKSQFRHVALIGKYHAQGSRFALEEVAGFLHTQGCEVTLEKDTASNTGLTQYPVLDVAGVGQHCDLALVIGGDGTMLGIGRQLAQFGVPLVGINQGRLGFITDIAFEDFQTALAPMLRGEFEEDRRWMMQASVVRDGRCVFKATAMNDVVVNRGATAGMVELRVAHRLDRLRAVSRGAVAAPVDTRLGAGTHCPAYPVQPAHRAFRRRRDHRGNCGRPRRQCQL